jgi:RHS repeat-associated protein
MVEPGRKFVKGSSKYRFGFNGKEKDNEDYGEGNAYDFGARIYDTRLGRFFSTDPMTAISPGESSYIFAGNNPIALTDFNGLFKISPYFVKKYPTLAKILKYVIPYYISDIKVRDEWVRKMGFNDKKVGQAAWTEMLTYGSGPWVTPTLRKGEIKATGLTGAGIWASRFGPGSGNKYDEGDGYIDNISFSSSMLENLEAALKQGNDEEVAFNAVRTMILIMHESGHWVRYNRVRKEERSGSRFNFEEGAIAEEAIFGRRYSYTNDVSAGANADAVRDDLIRATSNSFASMWKMFTNQTVTVSLKKASTPEGQTGDPVLKNAEIKEGKVFKSPTATRKGNTNSGNSPNTY